MTKESMGEFLESAVASVLRFNYNWQTVIENYHLPRPKSIKKKHEPKISSIEIDVFGISGSRLTEHRKILSPKERGEIILIQCKDEWYEHEHKPAVEFLEKAKKIVEEYYPNRNIRKVIVTLLLSPKALEDKRIENIYFICNVAHLKQRIKRSRKYKSLEKNLSGYLDNGKIGDLRDEILKPLLEIISKYLKNPNQTSLTNFPSLALQALRILVNITCFCNEYEGYPPFVSEKFWRCKRCK